MIALLIGGTVILCIGLLTVVFGIPIKEFSFGNTMILAGAVVSCTGPSTATSPSDYGRSEPVEQTARLIQDAGGTITISLGGYNGRELAVCGAGITIHDHR